MRLTRRRRSTRPGISMTPMIDIVFLLIIFFMTVTQVTEVNKERLELPKLEGSEDQRPTVLTINVTAEGAVMISGQRISLADLVLLVENEKRRLGGNVGLLTIVVRADQRGTSEMTNEVVRTLDQLRVEMIRIAVQVPEP